MSSSYGLHSDTIAFAPRQAFLQLFTLRNDQGGVKHRIGHFRIYGVPLSGKQTV